MLPLHSKLAVVEGGWEDEFVRAAERGGVSHLLRGRLDRVFLLRAGTVRKALMSIDTIHVDPSVDVTHICLDIFPSRGTRRVIGGVGSGVGSVHCRLNAHIHCRLHVVPRLGFFISSSLSCVRGVSSLLG